MEKSAQRRCQVLQYRISLKGNIARLYPDARFRSIADVCSKKVAPEYCSHFSFFCPPEFRNGTVGGSFRRAEFFADTSTPGSIPKST